MTGRDNELWQQCWRDRRTDFHQKTVNALLVRFWPRLTLPRKSRVLVPLCGKSLDLMWLAKQGHEVIGVELSPIAVRAFFRENMLRPIRRHVGAMTLWQHGQISILCGDFFALTRAELGEIDAVLDCAALTALPEDIRPAYVKHLRSLLLPGCKLVLLTTEDAEEGESRQDTLGEAPEITALFGADYDIELAHVESRREIDPGNARGPLLHSEKKVYLLGSKNLPVL